MFYSDKALKEAVRAGAAVFCFYSPQQAQLESAAAKTLSLLGEQDTELTTLEGPTPRVEELVMAAGTISFFGTQRLVELPMLKPSAYSDGDMTDFLDTLSSAENARFIITCLVTEEWGKLRLGKREQKFFAACEGLGYCAQLAKLRPADLVKLLQQRAAQLGCQLDAVVARSMVDRCGEDQLLLENEVDKLAALSGYTAITREMVDALGVQSLEGDAFEMIGLLTSGRLPQALAKLNLLFKLQNEPIAILGAMVSNYLDLYRLSCGTKAKVGYQQVHKDFHYKGSDYRLKKAQPTAQRFSRRQLRNCLDILQQTDLKMKSSPMDGKILLETTLFQLVMAGREN